MKKLKIIIVALILFIFASQAWAAGSSFTVSSDNMYYNPAINQKVFRVLILAFVADDATGAIPSLTLNSDTAGVRHGPLAGWYGYMVEIDGNHAGTEPTEDSELYIYQNGIDILGGDGVDQVDNTAEREVLFEANGVDVTRPIYDTLTVTVTQQAAATASATGTIRLILVP